MREEDNRATENERASLLTAALSKSHDEVERLIDQGISVAVTDVVGWTPLHYALIINYDDTSPDATRKTALTLIERGAPVNAETTVAGWRPLHLAVWQHDPAIVRALIEHGADVNAQMRLGGVTPLHLALHQYNVILYEARLAGWSQPRLEERRKAVDEFVTVLRAAGAIDRMDENAFPRHILDGWLFGERLVTYPKPSITMVYLSSPGFTIQGSFTSKGADESLIGERVGFVNEFEDFGSVLGILDKEGRMQLQWIADDSIDEPSLCSDAVSGLDHVSIVLEPSGTAHHPYTTYLYYDADSGLLVEGFDDYWFGHSTAEAGEDGVCNWQKVKEVVATYERVFPGLRVGEAITLESRSLFTMPTRTLERAMAESSLAALRALPSDVVNVSASLESPRWEVVKAYGSDSRRYNSHETGVLLVRDKEQNSWRSILDCPYIKLLELRDNILLFDMNEDCDGAMFTKKFRIRLNLLTMQAITMSSEDCESIDDCQLGDIVVQTDCEQADQNNIPGNDKSALAGQMVSIPGGIFRMGDLSGGGWDAEEPVHSVSVPEFRLGKYEVTFAQWDACVKYGGCDGYSPKDRGWGRCNRPVTHVSWNDAQTFIAWLNARTGGNYRLPTEAEWEYAARAGSATKYSWGDDIGENRANCDKECGDHWYYTAPVGSFAANAWGLHDMHGNVWEWVQDCWNYSYAEAPSDGSARVNGNCGKSVLRGGSFSLHDDAWSLRSAYRDSRSRSFRGSAIGFRLAQDL